MSETTSEIGPTPRILPHVHGRLASKFAEVNAVFMKPDLYVLETIESSIEQIQQQMQQEGKSFDPRGGLIAFACADASDELAIAETYLERHPLVVRDFLETRQVNHYDNLHLYDIHIDDDQWESFEHVGTPHEINIFDALSQSTNPSIETPRASLFIMKHIDFFGSEGKQTKDQKQKLALFQKNLPNFLEDIALVFINAGSLGLKNVPGFTPIHTDDLAVEKESRLDIYLYQNPSLTQK